MTGDRSDLEFHGEDFYGGGRLDDEIAVDWEARLAPFAVLIGAIITAAIATPIAIILWRVAL